MTVIVWTSTGCGPCYALKSKLRAAHIPFEERDAADADADTLARWRAARYSTPVVQYAGVEFSGIIPAKVQTLIDTH